MNINNKPCLCHSQKKYKKCCRPFHTASTQADTPQELLRARYSAYALGLADYIMSTTHPDNPEAEKQEDQWIAELKLFAKGSTFETLDVLHEDVREHEGWVTFKVGLSQGGHNASFTEKSHFLKVNGLWLYASAEEFEESADAESSTSETQTT